MHGIERKTKCFVSDVDKTFCQGTDVEQIDSKHPKLKLCQYENYDCFNLNSNASHAASIQ